MGLGSELVVPVELYIPTASRAAKGESKYIKKIPIYLETWTLGSLSPLGTKLQQWQ